MLGAMPELWELGTAEAKREAAAIAKDAASYIHPRLASIDQTINESYQNLKPRTCETTPMMWSALYRQRRAPEEGDFQSGVGSSPTAQKVYREQTGRSVDVARQKDPAHPAYRPLPRRSRRMSPRGIGS
jgi:hypothetical protein